MKLPLIPLCGLSLLTLAVRADAQVPQPPAPDAPQSVAAIAPEAPSPALTTAAPPPRRSHRAHRQSPAEAGVASANRAATREPIRAGFVNAVQVYPFSEGTLYQAYTAPERVTDIALQPGETLVSVAAGDTARWAIGDTTSGSGAAERTHVLVKPFLEGLSTNLVITTDRRSYHLALTSTPATAMVALSWTYPQDELIALRRAEEQCREAEPVASGLTLEQIHFNYAISGDRPAWRPLRAFDDGRQTYIEFPASLPVGEAPPLFLVNGKGEAQLVNYRLQGRFYVVDRIFDTAELRLGLKRQDVVRIARVSEEPRRRRDS